YQASGVRTEAAKATKLRSGTSRYASCDPRKSPKMRRKLPPARPKHGPPSRFARTDTCQSRPGHSAGTIQVQVPSARSRSGKTASSVDTMHLFAGRQEMENRRR